MIKLLKSQTNTTGSRIFDVSRLLTAKAGPLTTNPLSWVAAGKELSAKFCRQTSSVLWARPLTHGTRVPWVGLSSRHTRVTGCHGSPLDGVLCHEPHVVAMSHHLCRESTSSSGQCASLCREPLYSSSRQRACPLPWASRQRPSDRLPGTSSLLSARAAAHRKKATVALSFGFGSRQRDLLCFFVFSRNLYDPSNSTNHYKCIRGSLYIT